MMYRAVLTVMLLTGFAFQSSHAVNPTAGEIVKNTSTQVMERLRLEQEELKSNPDRIYSFVNQLVIPHFDFYNMSRWVLGNSWRRASEQQQQVFIEQFRTLLVRTYAKALLEYSAEEIQYYPEQVNPKSNIVVVKTEFKDTSGANLVPIHYRMHMIDGAWKVVDVSVDGISLVSTYRGSFASEIRKNGLDSLIAKLEDRNEKQDNTLD